MNVFACRNLLCEYASTNCRITASQRVLACDGWGATGLNGTGSDCGKGEGRMRPGGMGLSVGGESSELVWLALYICLWLWLPRWLGLRPCLYIPYGIHVHGVDVEDAFQDLFGSSDEDADIGESGSSGEDEDATPPAEIKGWHRKKPTVRFDILGVGHICYYKRYGRFMAT